MLQSITQYLFDCPQHGCGPMAPVDYEKLRKTAYLNFDGCSVYDLYGICLVYVTLISVWETLIKLPPVMELPVLILPLVFLFAVPWTMPFLLTASMVVLVVSNPKFGEDLSLSFMDEAKLKLRYLAEYRAYIMICTSVCILAVDFDIFPREHAKTEEYGYSGMDLGVGSVIFSNAIMASGRGTTKLLINRLKKALQSLTPLLVLGFGRLIFMKEYGYHVPPSEHGVHWNFFFTIAVVTLISAAVRPSLAAVAVVMIGYETFLRYGGTEYILHAPRTDFFSANREGILGCFGYVVLYWSGAFVSRWTKSDRASRNFFILSSATRVAVQAMTYWNMAPSRRLCNLPYVLHCISVNAFVLALVAMRDLYAQKPRPRLAYTLDGIQQNLLAIFLFANILTGLVNVSFQTLLQPHFKALLIIIVYSFTWSGLAQFLAIRGITLKFW